MSARRRIGLDAAARDELYEAIVVAVTGAAVTPLTIVVDDAQWSDAASLHAVQLLLSAIGDSPIAVVLLVRDDTSPTPDLAAVIHAVSRTRSGHRIVLEGLDEDAVREQLTNAFGSVPDDDAVRWLHERTAGNPFFLVETIRQLADAGSLDDVESMRRNVPATVVEFVTARIAQLPTTTGEVLRAGAVVGREFDQRIVAELVGIDRDRCFDAVEIAIVAGLIEEGSTATRLRFRHDLVRDAIYHRLTSVTRTRLHARAAVHLDTLLHGDRAHTNEVAAHAWRGRGAMPAVAVIEHLERAAMDNAQAGAFEAADTLLEQALSIVDDIADDTERLRVDDGCAVPPAADPRRDEGLRRAGHDGRHHPVAAAARSGVAPSRRGVARGARRLRVVGRRVAHCGPLVRHGGGDRATDRRRGCRGERPLPPGGHGVPTRRRAPGGAADE